MVTTNSILKRRAVFSIATIVLIAIAIASFTYAWFMNQRTLNSLTWIKTPIRLDIGAGNNHAIAQLDMGNIDANDGNAKYYVFCVYGQPVDIYSLQLAYTTNIPFNYDVYRADALDTPPSQLDDSIVPFTYVDDNGVLQTEYFTYDTKDCVIAAKRLSALTSDQISSHQSHELSFGNDEGKFDDANPDPLVQSNAEPLYWLAQENGVSAMNPRHIVRDQLVPYFCDYYVIKVSWEPGLTNNKETDIIYLTASR